jgi:hypothetical protein
MSRAAPNRYRAARKAMGISFGKTCNCNKKLVRRAGIEPAQPLRAEGF